MTSFINELQDRGLIQQSTDINTLAKLLDEEKIALYCGFDPTADSLHVGHLLPILVLKRFQLAGHTPIVLIGGATGMIGDPSFKANERSLNSASVVANWVEKLRGQLEPFLSFQGDNAAIMANNAEWTTNLNVLVFLRDVGKHFSVNAMMNKESVKQRLARDDVGISFTEFSYSLLQAYDYTQLNKLYNCQLEIGGSDQWGNITAGIELTRRINQANVYGLTLPLVTKSDGTKFGKTEGGAVWLNAKKTSPYQFYQFWLKVSDADVYKYLYYFSFLSIAEIKAIEEKDQASGLKPEAQSILAKELTKLIHGEEALAAAERISHCLFAEDQSGLTISDFEQLALDGLPSFEVKLPLTIIDALTITGLAKSNNEARTFLKQNSVHINGKLISDSTYVLAKTDLRHERYTILKRGKRNHALLIWNN